MTSKRFDLVLFFPSIYAIADSDYLLRLKNSLQKGGSALFIANAEDSFLAGLKTITDAPSDSSRALIADVIHDLQEAGFALETKESCTEFDDGITDAGLELDRHAAI